LNEGKRKPDAQATGCLYVCIQCNVYAVPRPLFKKMGKYKSRKVSNLRRSFPLHSSSRVMPHRISIPLPASHVVLEGFCDFEHTLDVFHAEDCFFG
jgi:hypothetical protein